VAFALFRGVDMRLYVHALDLEEGLALLIALCWKSIGRDGGGDVHPSDVCNPDDIVAAGQRA